MRQRLLCMAHRYCVRYIADTRSRQPLRAQVECLLRASDDTSGKMLDCKKLEPPPAASSPEEDDLNDLDGSTLSDKRPTRELKAALSQSHRVMKTLTVEYSDMAPAGEHEDIRFRDEQSSELDTTCSLIIQANRRSVSSPKPSSLIQEPRLIGLGVRSKMHKCRDRQSIASTRDRSLPTRDSSSPRKQSLSLKGRKIEMQCREQIEPKARARKARVRTIRFPPPLRELKKILPLFAANSSLWKLASRN